jgi:tetratricopeptide (TPR) repeat protein
VKQTMTILAAGLALVVSCKASAPTADPPADRGPSPERSVTEIGEPEDALGEPLMIALSQAKNFHHRADVYSKDGKLDQAADSLRRILDIPFPEGSPEGEDVRHDARARLAKLLLGRGLLDEAMATVEEGLASATRESFFVANLWRMRGQVFEVRGDLHEETDPRASAEARREAIRSYDRSIAINEELLSRLPEEPPR